VSYKEYPGSSCKEESQDLQQTRRTLQIPLLFCPDTVAYFHRDPKRTLTEFIQNTEIKNKEGNGKTIDM
jgi:hypothetical protein